MLHYVFNTSVRVLTAQCTGLPRPLLRVQVFTMMGYFSSDKLVGLPAGFLGAYPHLQAHQTKVAAHPKIAQYYQKHAYVGDRQQRRRDPGWKYGGVG